MSATAPGGRSSLEFVLVRSSYFQPGGLPPAVTAPAGDGRSRDAARLPDPPTAAVRPAPSIRPAGFAEGSTGAGPGDRDHRDRNGPMTPPAHGDRGAEPAGDGSPRRDGDCHLRPSGNESPDEPVPHITRLIVRGAGPERRVCPVNPTFKAVPRCAIMFLAPAGMLSTGLGARDLPAVAQGRDHGGRDLLTSSDRLDCGRAGRSTYPQSVSREGHRQCRRPPPLR